VINYELRYSIESRDPLENLPLFITPNLDIGYVVPEFDPSRNYTFIVLLTIIPFRAIEYLVPFSESYPFDCELF
jgi:hypothetical protein